MSAPIAETPSPRLIPGQVVRVRSRTYVVEGIEADQQSGQGTLVSLACLDDDAQGQRLDAIWELELDTEIIDTEAWQGIGRRGFDNPRHFSAYLHTLRWNCVTATDPRLFQAAVSRRNPTRRLPARPFGKSAAAATGKPLHRR
jgi:hypothetical protein